MARFPGSFFNSTVPIPYLKIDVISTIGYHVLQGPNHSIISLSLEAIEAQEKLRNAGLVPDN